MGSHCRPGPPHWRPRTRNLRLPATASSCPRARRTHHHHYPKKTNEARQAHSGKEAVRCRITVLLHQLPPMSRECAAGPRHRQRRTSGCDVRPGPITPTRSPNSNSRLATAAPLKTRRSFPALHTRPCRRAATRLRDRCSRRPLRTLPRRQKTRARCRRFPLSLPTRVSRVQATRWGRNRPR